MTTPLVDPSVRLDGKFAVVTGANTGIGKVTALELARAGAKVVLACRTKDKADAAMAEIRKEVPAAQLEFAALDLGSLASVKKTVEALKRGPRIDILVNNAGLAGYRGLTTDGFELTFGTNHLGPFALTTGLIDHLVDGGRVVIVASRAHFGPTGFDWEAQRQKTPSVSGYPQYRISKLANVLFAKELAKRLAPRRIDVSALHPGVVASDIWRRVPWPFRGVVKLFMITTEEGARTTLFCAADPSCAGKTGEYWDKCAVKKPSRAARDEALAAELWSRSAAWVAAVG